MIVRYIASSKDCLCGKRFGDRTITHFYMLKIITMNNTRFVLYARKSSEREDRQIQSIDDQINYWNKRAKEEGIEIIKIYTEEKSAKTPGRRAEFYTMCDDLEK